MKKNGSEVNQLKAGALLSYIAMAFGCIISIVYTPIMLRLLGQSEYGLYNLVASIVSYLGLLSFGLGGAYMRYFSLYKVQNKREKIAKLNGMFLIVFSVIGLIAILAGIILVNNIDIIFGKNLTAIELAKSKKLMSIMIFNLALSFPLSVFNSYITANEEYIFQRVLQLIKVVVNPFITLPLLLMGYKSVSMVVVTTLLNMMIEISNLIFCFKKLGIRFYFKDFDFYLIKEMSVFSFYIFLDMVINQVNWNVDKFILGRYRGTISVAIYGIAAQVNGYYLSISTTVSSVFIPRVNRMVATSNDDRELTDLFVRVGRIQFILLALICTGFIFFGTEFINIWAGIDYADAYFIILMLIISEFVPMIQSIGIEIQRAKNMHKFRSIIYSFIALGNLFISIPLAKRYGAIGAAIGTAIAQIIGTNIIMNVYYHVKIGIDIKYFWNQIFRLIPPLTLPVMGGFIMWWFLDFSNRLIYLTSGIAYVGLFGISVWLFGMNEYEKGMVITPITKLFRKG